MPNAINANFEHILCVLILITRLGDIISTRLATPTLILEANPLVRRLGWRFAMSSILVCLVPYYNTALGMSLFVAYCIVCMFNFMRVWQMRTMGEVEYHALMLTLARRSSLVRALVPFLIGQAFLASIGFVLMILSPDLSGWAF